MTGHQWGTIKAASRHPKLAHLRLVLVDIKPAESAESRAERNEATGTRKRRGGCGGVDEDRHDDGSAESMTKLADNTQRRL
jgi:hypothetical protein